MRSNIIRTRVFSNLSAQLTHDRLLPLHRFAHQYNKHSRMALPARRTVRSNHRHLAGPYRPSSGECSVNSGASPQEQSVSVRFSRTVIFARSGVIANRHSTMFASRVVVVAVGADVSCEALRIGRQNTSQGQHERPLLGSGHRTDGWLRMYLATWCSFLRLSPFHASSYAFYYLYRSRCSDDRIHLRGNELDTPFSFRAEGMNASPTIQIHADRLRNGTWCLTDRTYI